MSHHLFTHRDIPPGRKAVLETCEHCSALSWRYANNTRSYPVRRECTRGPWKEEINRKRLAEIERLEKRILELKQLINKG